MMTVMEPNLLVMIPLELLKSVAIERVLVKSLINLAAVRSLVEFYFVLYYIIGWLKFINKSTTRQS